MKPILLLVCPLLLSAAAPAAEPSGLEVGTAVVNIDPDVFPFQLRSGPSTHVHDSLHVRAIAFAGGDGRVAVAVIDAIGYGREQCDRAARLVAEKTGWKPEELLICATHTHSAPKGGDGSPGRIAYEKKRLAGIVEALTAAIGSLQPAEVGFGRDEEPGEVRNRRWFMKPGTMDPNPLGGRDRVRTNGPRRNLLKPAGPVDPAVCVVCARTRRRRPLALLANYALHYVGGIPKVSEENGRVAGTASADYFGEFARIVPFRVGGRNPPADFVAAMTNGASGDINNIDFAGTRPPRAPFEQVRVVASKAADAAWRAVKKIETYDRDPVVAVRRREVALAYRVPSAAAVKKAGELLALPRAERAAINKRTTAVARKTLAFADPAHPNGEKVIVQAVRIGTTAVVTMPFEVLVEIGLAIKEKSPFPNTFLIELANGSSGYLPPPRQHALGGYETWLCSARFQVDASEILTRHLLEMLRELKG